ncbi:hypothetical protein [Deinococcus misasensis]|uniref:hypothetical protein n=1 Tax=Deinococcus misasensis TaxID=392413 RepID=UPI00055634AD|nr:hypothetical protein [Deinococcus misasensis]
MNSGFLMHQNEVKRTVLFDPKYTTLNTETLVLDFQKPPIPMAYLEEKPNLDHEMHRMNHVLLYALGGTNV